MKRFKRILSAILSVILVLTTTGILSSCAKNNKLYVSNVEWIAMVDDGFGMQTYNNSKPYIKSISSDNKYFDAVQIACEWNVIDSNEPFEAEKPLKLSYALITLVNCGRFVDENASNDEKIKYGLENFKVKNINLNKTKLRKKLDKQSASSLIESAKTLWANERILKNEENVEFSDDIKDFTSSQTPLNDYKILDNGVIAIPKSSLDNYSKDSAAGKSKINKGDTYVLPSNGKTLGTKAYKAESVTEDDKNFYVKNSSEDLDLYDIAENIDVKETISPTSENTVIYDGNGNVIYSPENVIDKVNYNSYNSPEISQLGLTNTPDAIPCATKKSKTFKVGEYSIKLEYALGKKLDLNVAATYEHKSKTEQSSIGCTASAGISDLEATQKVDFKHFKLKEAKLNLNYKTNTSFSVKYSNNKSGFFAPPMSNGNGKYLTNVLKATLKDKSNSKGAKTIKICSLDVYSVGVCRLCIDVNLKIQFDGTVSIVLTQYGSKGAEYSNGKLRFINTGEPDLDLQAKATLEGTLGMGPALYVVGLKKSIIGLQIVFGAGIQASATVHLVDPENHLIEESSSFKGINIEDIETASSGKIVADSTAIEQVAKSQGAVYKSESSKINLNLDTCVDVSAYAILRVEVTDESYAAKLLGNKLSLSYEFLGSKNAKFLNVHVENNDWSKAKASFGMKNTKKELCTKKFTPFDKDEPTTNESDDKEYDQNSGFATNKISYTLNEGQKEKIVISHLPKGYSKNDVVYESNDDSIAKVSSDGTVTGVSSGTVNVKVSTKDKKYTADCVIYVVQRVSLNYPITSSYNYYNV